MSVEQDDLIGVPAETAARLVGITLPRLYSWETTGLVRPAVHRELSPRNVVRLYAFQQLVELFVVRQLEIEHELHIQHIMFVVNAVRSDDHPRPLSSLRWAVSNGEICVEYPDGGWINDRRPSQGVFIQTLDLELIRTNVRSAVRSGRDPADVGKAEKRRGVRGSRPVFAGTRTPVATVQAYLRQGYEVERILESLPHLEREDIEYARRELGAA